MNDTSSITRKDLFREAAKVGLIDNPENWFKYNRARTESSHTYNQSLAEDVYEAVRAFLPDCQRLLNALKQYHD